MKEIDARGLSCPQPVLMTLKAMTAAEEMVVIVDNETARENVVRAVKSRGWQLKTLREEDGVFRLIVAKN